MTRTILSSVKVAIRSVNYERGCIWLRHFIFFLVSVLSLREAY
jgi:hypothetical protein